MRCSGRAPNKMTVVLTNDTLVITLHGVLSPAEKALAKNSAVADQVEEFHQQLFASSSDALDRGDQKNHGPSRARGDGGNRDQHRHGREGVHDRHRGTGVPARRQRAHGRLERKRGRT